MTNQEAGYKMIKFFIQAGLFIWVLTYGEPDLLDSLIQFLIR